MNERPAYVPFTEAMFRAMRRLDPDQVADLMDMLYVYAFDGDEPKGDGAAAAVFEVIRPGIDKAFDSLRKKREAGRARHQTQAPASTVQQESADASTAQQTSAQVSTVPADASTSEQNRQIKSKGKSKTPPPKEGEGGSRGGEPPSPPASKRFVPPSLDEVRAYGLDYCRQKGYPPGIFDAEDFCDHWQSKGWKRGRTPMKDWQASAREWIRKDYRDNPNAGKEAPSGLFTAYDFDDGLHA